jgi:hypothetical protein
MRPPTRRLLATIAALAGLALVAGACGGDSGAGLSEPGDGGDKVTIAGDSISVGLGSALRDELGDTRDVKVIGVPGTGLAREDSFDWPTRLEQLAAEFPPDVLVLSLGSNDAQDLVGPDGRVVATMSDDEAWDAEYRARLAASFDAFRDTGTTVLWVGHVRTREDRVGLVNRHVHELAAEVAADRDWVVVADLAELLDSGEDVASDCLVPDGVHLRTTCLQDAAQQLAGRAPIG